MELFPQIITATLLEDLSIELSVGKTEKDSEFAKAINAGGYGLINQKRLDYLAWLDAPNNERGGH